jgi:hypothetical protein
MGKEIFKYPDTNSSRAKIEFLNRKLHHQKVAIIGLGGTGSYILDLLTKTPVSEIHIFDSDFFLLHNAFRAPGAIDIAILETTGGLKKCDYYYKVYSRMHNGIVVHNYNVTAENLNELSGFNYVFICVDRNSTRSMLTKGISELHIPFIDTGLGVKMLDDSLIGTLRVTTGSVKKNYHLDERIGEDEFEENEYSTNIQIADLNCMNAVMAVLKWKKLSGFYQDLKQEHNSLYFINTNKLLNEDHTT